MNALASWTRWVWRSPPRDVLVEMISPYWAKPYVGYVDDINPQADVCHVSWRLTGIGREQASQ
jgi:hypothetical protein